jgi:hypothetical protein
MLITQVADYATLGALPPEIHAIARIMSLLAIFWAYLCTERTIKV